MVVDYRIRGRALDSWVGEVPWVNLAASIVFRSLAVDKGP